LIDRAVIPKRPRLLSPEEFAAYSSDVCLHALFERQAARTPDAIALVFEDAQLSYAALDRQANRLAHDLVASGVGPDVRVGLCVDRSLDMLVARLAPFFADTPARLVVLDGETRDAAGPIEAPARAARALSIPHHSRSRS
jgi:non-ribosomal peptide synthetase component F